MQCGMPGLFAILPICHSCSFSFPQSLPPSLCPCPSIIEAVSFSKTYFLVVTRIDLGCSFGRSEESIHQQLTRPLLEACFLHFYLSEISSKPVYLPIPSSGCLLTWSLVSRRANVCFWPLANTSSYVTPQTPAPTHPCTPGLLFLSSRCLQQWSMNALNRQIIGQQHLVWMWLNIQTKRSTVFQPNSV